MVLFECKGAMAKRSAAMLLRIMPAPDEAGLGHGTQSCNSYQRRKVDGSLRLEQRIDEAFVFEAQRAQGFAFFVVGKGRIVEDGAHVIEQNHFPVRAGDRVGEIRSRTGAAAGKGYSDKGC